MRLGWLLLSRCLCTTEITSITSLAARTEVFPLSYGGETSVTSKPTILGASRLMHFLTSRELSPNGSGVPVPGANAGSIPETAGDAALLFNPVYERSLEEALRNVLSNESLRTDLITRGLGNVQRFSWLETARLTLKVYQSLLD